MGGRPKEIIDLVGLRSLVTYGKYGQLEGLVGRPGSVLSSPGTPVLLPKGTGQDRPMKLCKRSQKFPVRVHTRNVLLNPQFLR